MLTDPRPECFAFDNTIKRDCTILETDTCKDCAFFKTNRQYVEDLEKYESKGDEYGY